MRWGRRSRGRTLRRRGDGRSSARSIGGWTPIIGALLLLGVDVGCYRGDFLDLACDRQGTCIGTDSGSSGTLVTSSMTSSGSDSGATSTTDATGSTTTAGSVSSLDAYRLRSVTIVDPHVYYDLGGCGDRTALLNYAISEEIKAGGSLSMALLFDPADPKAAETPMILVEADCTVGPEGTRCWQQPGGTEVKVAATNSQDLACDVTRPGTINPLYMAEGAPNLAAPPCFTSPRGTVILPSLAEGLPPLVLFDAQITATYGLGGVDMGVDVLKTGLITGFIPESSARDLEGLIADLPFNLWGTIAGGDGCQPDINNPIDDTDPDPNPESTERGLQMYLNFEAERIVWLE